MSGLTGSSSADSDQAIWVTLWISGTVAPERLAVDEGLESVITRVTRLLMAQCVTDGARFRILTTAASNGLEGEFERAVARIAQREGLPLHLIAPGLPAPLAPAQAAAQRQVWLGAEQEHLESGEPHRLSREIALGFSDLVLCVGGLTPELAKFPQTLLQFGTVSAAALAMKPVIWIDETGAVRGMELAALTPAQRHLMGSGQPAVQWMPQSFSHPLDETGLRAWLVTVFEPLAGSVGARPVASSRAGQVHNALMSLAQARPAKALRSLLAGPITPYRGPTWAGDADLVAPTATLDASFDAADVEASVAAGKYRSAVWISSAASTLAVFSAVAGAIGLWPGQSGVFWAVAEVFLVALVIGLLWRVKQQDWHARWVRSRFLAEQLRYARLGLPLLSLGSKVLMPFREVVQDRDGMDRVLLASSELRDLQRCLTGTGLPRPASGGAFVVATEAALLSQRNYVLSVINDQIAYHDRAHHDQHAAEHRLHNLTVILFCLTAAAVLGHFVLHAQWLLIFTAFFPALAAGVHGLSTSLEISRIAEQSKATSSGLREIADAVRLAVNEDARPWEGWLQLRHLTRLAAELMSDENGQWQKLVSHQKPKLPA
jgi:hypothetical protein